MAEFVNLFTGMIPDRKLSPEELIRAIRLDIAAEEEATHLYEAQAEATDNQRAKKILLDIAKEEIVHVGEFQKLLVQLSPEESDLLNKRVGEVVQKVGLSMERKMNILEAKDLDVYKRLLKVLGEYTDKFPGTGVSRMFDQALGSGKKILPKDKLAIDILHFILKNNSVPSAVHKILNFRFSNLPIELRPLVKNGRSKEVAHWSRESLVSDKIKDLIDWEGTGKAGSWSDVDGNKVKLYDMSLVEEQTTIAPVKPKPDVPVPIRRPREKPKSPIVPTPHQTPEPKGEKANLHNKDVELFKKRRLE